MQPIRYVRAKEFELAVYFNHLIYTDKHGEARLEYSTDGSGDFAGEHTSFEHLYDILKERPELRMVRNGTAIAATSFQGDEGFLEDAPDVIGKIAQISDWLGITTPMQADVS
ncbi:MAG: hypothetical protein J4400_00745 [Candidatus Aenigmarchaeota archaeon]|nr:hypothetical protein [Candidatus Aenigmarchaeota archaeon]